MRHFVIPRADYEIVEDSWNVMGLKGTGSKDVRMTDVFIPDYRVVEAMTMLNGGYEHRQPGKTLYRMKFPIVFSPRQSRPAPRASPRARCRPTATTWSQRVSADGIVAKNDSSQLVVYGEAAADVAASRCHLLLNDASCTTTSSKGGEVSLGPSGSRSAVTRCAPRAAPSTPIDRLYKISGASGIRTDFPNERYWRDMQVGLSHICNVAETIYAGWATDDLGGEAAPALFV